MSKQKRLIDANEKAVVDAAPTIDPESLMPVGRWEPVHEAKFVNGHPLFADGYECSECHKGHSGGNYCEHCGARMVD